MHYYEALLVLRRLSEGGRTFNAKDLAEAAEIQSTRKSTAAQIASGILSTLKRWGLVRYAGSIPGEGTRKIRLYALTKWGERFRPEKRAK